MKRHVEDEIDKAIRAAVTSELERIPVRGKAEGWRRIERQLYAKPPERLSGRMWLLGACVAAAVLLAWVFGSSSPPVTPEDRMSAEIEYQLKQIVSSIEFKPIVFSGSSKEWRLAKVEVQTEEASKKVVMVYRDTRGRDIVLSQHPIVWLPKGSVHELQEKLESARDLSAITFTHRSDGAIEAKWVEKGLQLSVTAATDVNTLQHFLTQLELYGEEG